MSADDEKPPLDAALRHLAEQQRRSLTSHPTPQELAAYHAGELPPEAEVRILDHLAVCRHCSDLLLDLAGFADLKPPEGVPELTDQQVEQDWQALRAKMRAGEGREDEERRVAAVVPIRSAGPVPRPERTLPVWLPVAASLLAVLGFSFGLYQSVQAGKRGTPRVVSAIYLDQERGGPDLPRVSSRDGGIIFLQPDPETSYPEYEAEVIREEDGKVLARIHVGKIEADPVPLLIPGPVKPGPYKVRLFGIDRGKKELSANLPFKADEP